MRGIRRRCPDRDAIENPAPPRRGVADGVLRWQPRPDLQSSRGGAGRHCTDSGAPIGPKVEGGSARPGRPRSSDWSGQIGREGGWKGNHRAAEPHSPPGSIPVHGNFFLFFFFKYF